MYYPPYHVQFSFTLKGYWQICMKDWCNGVLQQNVLKIRSSDDYCVWYFSTPQHNFILGHLWKVPFAQYSSQSIPTTIQSSAWRTSVLKDVERIHLPSRLISPNSFRFLTPTNFRVAGIFQCLRENMSERFSEIFNMHTDGWVLFK